MMSGTVITSCAHYLYNRYERGGVSTDECSLRRILSVLKPVSVIAVVDFEKKPAAHVGGSPLDIVRFGLAYAATSAV
jgi:hypothetical protein